MTEVFQHNSPVCLGVAENHCPARRHLTVTPWCWILLSWTWHSDSKHHSVWQNL